jgi:glycosyltransferase involved in cell wall biosynthesis
LKGISTAVPVSQAGKDHLDSLYPRFAGKVVVMRCGTRGNGRRSLPSKDGILRIVSCSYLVPVKRVHLMVETLASLDSNVEWHHVGDGHLRPELEALSRELGVDQRFFFHGMIDSRMILEFYTNRPFDLFVNLSESEGVPISIMEAFSAGLPVLATAVGGTGEIVDDHVGRSLRPDVTPSELAVEIRSLASMGEEEKQNMRDRAYARYLDRCDADRLARELSEFLVS